MDLKGALDRASVLALALTCAVLCSGAARVRETVELRTVSDAPPGNARVLYQPGLETIAGELAPRARDLYRGLENTFGWPPGPGVDVVLLNDSELFATLVPDGRLFTGVAVAAENRILLDVQKLARSPYGLEETLHHELVHIVLGQHISPGSLPRWFNEGLAQLLSGGVSELPETVDADTLRRAALTNQLISFSQLTSGFPSSPLSLQLAYGQSLSMVTYLERRMGREKLLVLVEELGRGSSFYQAVQAAMGEEFPTLEASWKRNMVQKASWIAYLADHLYWVLFFAAAVLTLWGFFRLKQRNRRVVEEWEQSEEESKSTNGGPP